MSSTCRTSAVCLCFSVALDTLGQDFSRSSIGHCLALGTGNRSHKTRAIVPSELRQCPSRFCWEGSTHKVQSFGVARVHRLRNSTISRCWEGRIPKWWRARRYLREISISAQLGNNRASDNASSLHDQSLVTLVPPSSARANP